MARSIGTTVVFAAILLTPLAASLAYLALESASTEASTVIVAPTPASVAPAAPLAPVAAPVAVSPPPAELTTASEPAAPVEAAAPVEPVEEEARPLLAANEALLMHDGALVLAANPSLAWGTGRMKVDPIDAGYTVHREVAIERLPASLQAVIGARYNLYSAEGGICDAQVSGVSLYGEETGQHFTESDEKPTRADMREMAKELDNGTYVLEARLAAPDGCTPVWARSADLPPPIVFARGIDDPSLRPRVLEHMKTLRGIRRMSAERRGYLRDLDAEERSKQLPWAAFLDAQLKFVRWDEIGGTRGFVTAQVTHDDGCGGFNPDPVTMLFELNGDILTPHADPGFLDPIALMDVDRDGHLEAVTGDATNLETRGPRPLAFRYSFLSVFCPC